MAILLTGADSLFVREGHLAGGLNELVANIGTELGNRVNSIFADYDSAAQDLIDSLYTTRDSYRGSHSSLTSYLTALGGNTIIRMADDDVKLVSKDLTTAMAELIAQMKSAAASVNASVPGSSVTAASGNTSNASVMVSTIGPDGKDLQYLFAETLELIVTGDEQSGEATGHQEPYTLKGEVPVDDPLAFDWPKGSGADGSGNLIDANVDNGQNLLTNSDFEKFTTANQPDNWTLVTTTPGTTLFSAGSSDAFRYSNALKITGTGGAELTHLYQQFNVSTGTLGKLKPLTVYALNFWIKATAAGVPAAGVLRVAFTDGSNAVFNDAAGTANSTSITLSGITTSFVKRTAFFRTPAVLPTTQRLELKITTAIESGKSIVIDGLAVAEPQPAYVGGPYVAAFAGSIKAIKLDKWSLAMTNTYGAFQKWFERAFGMRQLGMTLPFSGAPTISDGLVV